MAEKAATGSLEWGIRASFRAYIDALADVRLDANGAQIRDDCFVFPGRPDGRGFHGSISISAHAGALHVMLAEPAVVQGTTTAELSAEVGTGRIVVARLLDIRNAEAFLTGGGEAADVALTLDGSTWLGGVYNPWTRMDPVRVIPSQGERP